MASASSVSEAYQGFKTATEEILGRFRASVPISPPFSVSCPPVHDDSKLMLVVQLQNMWAKFCEDLLELSVLGKGPTLAGRSLVEIAVPLSGYSTQSYLRKIKGEVAQELPWHVEYPIWHSTEYVVRLSNRLQPDNDNEIQTGLGASIEVRNLNTIRNYIVHGSNKTACMELLTRYRAERLSIPQFLLMDNGSGASVFEEWITDLLSAAKNGAR